MCETPAPKRHASSQWKRAGVQYTGASVPCSLSRRAAGTVLAKEGCRGRPGCVAGGDRDTIAGFPVPPSGGQETLRGHPSLRPGCCWPQQTFPGQASLSQHPARPACLQQPPQSHTLPCTWPACPTSSLPTLTHPGSWRSYKAPPWKGQRNLLQVQSVNHVKYSSVELQGFHPTQGERRETWSESHSFCPQAAV